VVYLTLKEDEMDRACNTHYEEEACMRDFSEKARRTDSATKAQT
jgi:hypothetical protein